MAGTIVTDRIESDASYASSINIASPVVISNTITVRSGSTDAFIIDSSGRASLGTTPSNWGSGGTLEFTGQSLGSIHNTGGYANFSFSRNAFFNPSSSFWNYKATANAALYQIETEAHNFYGAASGTSSTPISWTQLLSFERGKTLALQGATTKTGTGITFPASQNASSDPNTLDDYEEGTWTPTDASGAGLGNFSQVTAAYYRKIGNFVFVSFYIQFPSTANSNAAYIGGLPFTSNDSYYYLIARNGALTGGTVRLQVDATTNSLRPYNAEGIPTNAQLSNGYFLASGSYIAAS